MRTTVTFEPDVAQMLKKAERESKLPFKQLINNLVRAGLQKTIANSKPQKFTLKTFKMGYKTSLTLDKGLAIADSLEDEELTRKLIIHK